MGISIPIPSHAQLHGGGFEAGFLHPVLGFDHLLAMVAVGIIATLIGGRATVLVPLSFVMVMFIGSLFGFYGLILSIDELGIALSVLLLGIGVAKQKSLPIFITMGFVSFFAFFHGHAHGVEMPRIASMINYISGFVTATILLHLAGVGIAIASQKIPNGTHYVHHLGSFIAGIGFYILYPNLI